MVNQSKQKNAEKALFDQYIKSITIDGQMMAMGQILEHAARQNPDNVALICKDQSLTYAELYKRATALSILLQQKGVKPKDRVVLIFENSIEFYIGYYGIVQTGAVVAPLNTFLKERELAHIISDAKPTLIIASTAFSSLFELLDKATLPPILSQDDFPGAETTVSAFKAHALQPDDLAALLYTSGTTGLPKGVMLSSRNIMTNMGQGIARLNFVKNERIFGVLPLFHSFAQSTCVWASIFLGCTVIIVPKIDRHALLEGLRHQPTIFLGVPALYGLLCLLRTAPIDTIKLFVSGGDAMPDSIRSYFALIYRRIICSGYGLTEASPFVSVNLEDGLSRANTVGYPMVGIECLFKDEDGTIVPQGKIGELWIKGDNVMMGYYNAPEMSDAVLQNGWLNTGDLAYLDERGKLVISGRLKDIIKSKGFIIYPQEIENVLLTHPNVLRAAVVGKKDEQVGEVSVAFVQLRKADPDMPHKLKELCKQNLADYKVPKIFYCSDEALPTTATGKVDKKQLRVRLEQR